MVTSISKTQLLGRIGQEPKVTVTQGGKTIVNLSLATTDSYKDQAGEWQKRTEWHDLVAFQKDAENLRDFAHKGDQLYVEGKIQTRSWDDKESGQKRFKTEIIIDVVSFPLGARKNASDGVEGSSQVSEEETFASATPF
jgi:single-strand DNA-binding protein